MDSKTRVLVVQLQIASVGVLLGIFGGLWKESWLLITGLLIFAYGLIRAFLLSSLMKKTEASDENDSYGFEDFYASHEDEEDEKDEWESALEHHLERRYGKGSEDSETKSSRSDKKP